MTTQRIRIRSQIIEVEVLSGDQARKALDKVVSHDTNPYHVIRRKTKAAMALFNMTEEEAEAFVLAREQVW